MYSQPQSRIYNQYKTARNKGGGIDDLFDTTIRLRGWPLIVLLCGALFAIYALVSLKPFEPAVDVRWNNILQFAEKNNLEVSNKITMGAFKHAGLVHSLRGLKAVEDIKVGEPLLTIPASAMLVNSSSLLSESRLGFLFEEKRRELHRLCDPCDLMAFILLDERRENYESKWKDYLELLELPAALVEQHPMLMSSYRLSQQDPILRLFVTENRRIARQCYEAVFDLPDVRRDRAIGTLDTPYPHAVYHKYLTTTLQCSARHFGIMVRIFNQDGTSESKRHLALLPIADMINGPDPLNPRVNVRLQTKPNSKNPNLDDYVVESSRFIRRDSELIADWFPSNVCREEMLCSYGFAPSTAQPCRIE